MVIGTSEDLARPPSIAVAGPIIHGLSSATNLWTPVNATSRTSCTRRKSLGELLLCKRVYSQWLNQRLRCLLTKRPLSRFPSLRRVNISPVSDASKHELARRYDSISYGSSPCAKALTPKFCEWRLPKLLSSNKWVIKMEPRMKTSFARGTCFRQLESLRTAAK